MMQEKDESFMEKFYIRMKTRRESLYPCVLAGMASSESVLAREPDYTYFMDTSEG